MEPFIKLTDVSQLTGIPKITLRRWILQGIGPACKRSPTGVFLFRQSEVEEWIETLPAPRPNSTRAK
jgi:predicted DNA-binding transcriptional regulator AlpA